MFTNNFGLKLFSLLLAVILELYLNSPDKWVTETLPVPMVVRNLSQNMMIISPFQEAGLTAQVKFQGPKTQIKQIESFSPKFIVDLPIPNPDSWVAFLDEKQLTLPSRVEAVEVKPTSIELLLERVVRKELTVVPNVVGTPGNGHKLEEVIVHPKKIIARGPFSELESLNAVETQQVDIEKMMKNQFFEVPLIDKGGRFTTLDVNFVSVEVIIKPIMAERTLSSVGVKVLAPTGFAGTAEPSSVQVILSGNESAINAINAKEVVLVADGTNLASGHHEIKLKGTFPPGVEMLKTVPPQVTLTLVSGRSNATGEK